MNQNIIRRILLISPSFYAMIAGALVSAVINILTGTEHMDFNRWLTIFCLIASSLMLILLNLIIEGFRLRSSGDIKYDRDPSLIDFILIPDNDVEKMIMHRRKSIFLILFLSIFFVILALYFNIGGDESWIISENLTAK
jgi:hypothetical protein